MPRRKQHVKEMEKYEVRVPSSMTRITLGPMFSDWEEQRSAAGFGPSGQQQWVRHLLEVHSLACEGQGCSRMYDAASTQQGNNKSPKGKSPKRSTSPRTKPDMSVVKSRGRSRKGSPHRNTFVYVNSQVSEDDDDDDYENQMEIDETVKPLSEDSESDSTNGGAVDKQEAVEEESTEEKQTGSIAENDIQAGSQETTKGLEDIFDGNNTISTQQQVDNNHVENNDQTITFEQIIDEPQVKQDTQVKPEAPHTTPPSSPSMTTASSTSNESTLPVTAEYREVRLRRGNGYYIKEYIYIKNRDCNGKIFLRCQFRASCRARAVVLVDTGRVIVTQGTHTHPPPHPQMIRFGPHIKDISATWANRVAKKTAAQNKTSGDHHRKPIQIITKHSRKHANRPIVINQSISKPTIKQQRTIPIVTVPSSMVNISPSPSAAPVTTYSFVPQFTTTQGNTTINAGNSILNIQPQQIQPKQDVLPAATTKVNSGMPLIVKSWSLLKGAQPTNNIITQPMNVLQQAKCLLLQSGTNNSQPQLINVSSQPQVYNFNPAIISQPINNFAAQSSLLQRVVLSPDQNATNLSLKDNLQHFVVNQNLTTDLLNSQSITTVQPQPTSPLPVQLVAAQPFTPDNNGVQLTEEMMEGEAVLTEEGSSEMNGSSLDLRVTSASEGGKEKKGGKKRGNIFSIAEKLMKQKQQGIDDSE